MIHYAPWREWPCMFRCSRHLVLKPGSRENRTGSGFLFLNLPRNLQQTSMKSTRMRERGFRVSSESYLIESPVKWVLIFHYDVVFVCMINLWIYTDVYQCVRQCEVNDVKLFPKILIRWVYAPGFDCCKLHLVRSRS